MWSTGRRPARHPRRDRQASAGERTIHPTGPRVGERSAAAGSTGRLGRAGQRRAWLSIVGASATVFARVRLPGVRFGSGLARFEDLQLPIRLACDEYTPAGRVYGHGVRLADGSVAGDLAQRAPFQRELDHALLGGQRYPQLVAPGVYGYPIR